MSRDIRAPDERSDPYRFCLDTLVARWFDRGMGAVRVFTAPSRPDGKGPPALTPVHTAVLSDAHAVSSFCPASGRFVFIEIDDVEAATPDTDSALEGFVVLDFLFVSVILWLGLLCAYFFFCCGRKHDMCRRYRQCRLGGREARVHHMQTSKRCIWIFLGG